MSAAGPNAELPPERTWESVAVGDVAERPPVRLDWTNLVLQVSGSQDLSRVHHDPEFAASSGHQQVFFNTGWTHAMLYSVLSDWIGPWGWIRSLEFRMREMNTLGDTVTARATVTDTMQLDGAGGVRLDVELVNDRRGVTTTGVAIVTLPTAEEISARREGRR